MIRQCHDKLSEVLHARRENAHHLDLLAGTSEHIATARRLINDLLGIANAMIPVYSPDGEPNEWPADIAGNLRCEIERLDVIEDDVKNRGNQLRSKLRQTGSETDWRIINEYIRQANFNQERRMSIAAILDRLRSRHSAATRTSAELAAALVEGNEVSEDEIEAALRNSSLTVNDFENMVAVLEQRHAAAEQAARITEEEVESAVGASRRASDDLKAKRQKLEELQVAVRAAHEAANQASSRVSRLNAEIDKANRKKVFVFQSTGGGETWRDADFSSGSVRPLESEKPCAVDPHVGGTYTRA